MGKNMTIYFSDDVLELIGEVDGKGTLINELIREHFSHDEETLRRKVDMAEQEFNALNARLKLKVQQREDLLQQQKKIKKQTQAQIDRANVVAGIKAQYDAGEMTTDEYLNWFNDNPPSKKKR
tara:strand:- start:50 stop:418 length:369 start_codon:yes stop_codon:yes gene_type:complete